MPARSSSTPATSRTGELGLATWVGSFDMGILSASALKLEGEASLVIGRVACLIAKPSPQGHPAPIRRLALLDLRVVGAERRCRVVEMQRLPGAASGGEQS